jgi:hypothetical protein
MKKQQILLSLILVSTMAIPALAQGKRNGLPPTSMDSFVKQAAGNADLIYGDEGVVDIPPYDYFDPIHRINNGIYDIRRAGLTTGHGSYLPDAWGADEFIGNEWSMSGANSSVAPGGVRYTNAAPTPGGDPASNAPSANPTSQPPPQQGRRFQQGPGDTGNTTTVIRSPAIMNPRQRPNGGQ